MSINYNPKIVTDGLVLYLDAANPKSIKKRSSNLLNWDSWTVGTGSVTGYTVNGTVDENRRILDTNPFGHSDVVWDTPSNDATSDADGGWEGSNIDIDPTKMYRFSTWVRRKVLGNGTFYLGCHGKDSVGSNVGVLNRSNAAVNTNPYFSATGWWGSATTWYLVVGHVWPVGSGTGAMHVDSAIYNTSGTKVATTQDFVWQSTTVKTTHRSYLYYSTDPTTNQQWYHPRVDLCNGSEPTISELLNNIENTWYDLSGNGNNGILTNGPKYTSANNGSLVFDGIDDYANIAHNSNLDIVTDFTVSFWLLDYGVSMDWKGILGKHTSYGHPAATGQGIAIYQSNSNINLWWTTNTSGVQQFITNARNGTWNLITMGRNGSNIFWAKNDTVSSYSWNSGTLTNTVPLILGQGWQYAGCQISNIQFYNRALSANEIQQNFNATRGRYGL